MTLLATGRKETLVVEQTPGRLNAAQIAEARKVLDRIKFHPRESLPNTTALARADALYVELVGERRLLLGEAIASFRGALESQEPAAIETTRAQLLRLVDGLTAAPTSSA
jgi:molecular chaperone HscC